MIGDLLCSAIETAGHTVAARYRSADQIKDLGPNNSVVVHLSDATGDAIRQIREIRAMSPESAIIVLCGRAVAANVRTQLGLGVDAVIPDDQHMNLVISSLIVVENGFKMFHHSQIPNNKNAVEPAKGTQNNGIGSISDIERSNLSKREAAILGQLLVGSSNKEIANDLGIADTTVKVHVRSIFIKTGVKNRTQAALWASEHLT